MYTPDTEEGQKELSKQVAASYAHIVFTLIEKSDISYKEKLSLLEKIAKEDILSTKNKLPEQTD